MGSLFLMCYSVYIINTPLYIRNSSIYNGFIYGEGGYNIMKFNKKAQTGQVGGLIAGIIGLIFMVVVGFVSVNILTDSGLLTSLSASANATDRLVGNLTEGVDNVSAKIPTLFTIAVAVLLLGLIVFLVLRARQTQQAQGGTI